MKATHVIEAVAPCPTGLQEHDVYHIEVSTERLVRIEEIEATVDELTKEALFQEDLTQALADRLGATVKTSGRHSRVWTEVEAGARERELVG